MKMLLTRVGAGSKMVVLGDPDQHDRGFEENGLTDLMNRIGTSDSIGHVQFTEDDVIRAEVIKEILKIYKNV
jgi:phosphate starvation-inducible PhoH-like protein